MSIVRRLYAWLTGRRVVHLMDHDGTVTERIRYFDGFGPFAHRLRGINRRVRLLEGGRTSGVSYVEQWAFADTKPALGGAAKEGQP